jgi:hypothetical protein
MQGFLRNNAIVWPITTKSKNSEKEDLLMLLQMNGVKGVVNYNQQDVVLMSLAGKILTGALLKIRSDRVTFESVNRSYNIFETCKYFIHA